MAETTESKKTKIFVEEVRHDKDGSMEIVSVNSKRVALKRGEYHEVDPDIAEAYEYKRKLRKEAQEYRNGLKEKEEEKARRDGAFAITGN